MVSGEVEAEKNGEDNVKAIQIEMSFPLCLLLLTPDHRYPKRMWSSDLLWFPLGGAGGES